MGGLILFKSSGFPTDGKITYSDSNADTGLALSIGGGFDSAEQKAQLSRSDGLQSNVLGTSSHSRSRPGRRWSLAERDIQEEKKWKRKIRIWL